MVGEWEGRKMDEMKVKEIALNPFAPDYIHSGADNNNDNNNYNNNNMQQW